MYKKWGLLTEDVCWMTFNSGLLVFRRGVLMWGSDDVRSVTRNRFADEFMLLVLTGCIQQNLQSVFRQDTGCLFLCVRILEVFVE